MELSIGEFSDHSQILRGKRSKRKRPSTSPPFNFAPAVTSSYSSGSAGGGTSFSAHEYSPATSTDVSAPNEEEILEEMANCLIMLAESLANNYKSNHHHHDYSEKVISRRLTDTATAAGNSSCLYECKTCNRTFPSFQALGGHRTSHTKPNKVVPVSPLPEEIETKALILPKLLTEKVNSASTVHHVPPLSFLIRSGNSRASSKVHECSICDAEFSSGQALGGHMRRHRKMPAPIKTTTTPLSPMMVMTNYSGDQTETSHEENGGGGRRETMSWDLNLPAPEYDEEEDTFQAMV